MTQVNQATEIEGITVLTDMRGINLIVSASTCIPVRYWETAILYSHLVVETPLRRNPGLRYVAGLWVIAQGEFSGMRQEIWLATDKEEVEKIPQMERLYDAVSFLGVLQVHPNVADEAVDLQRRQDLAAAPRPLRSARARASRRQDSTAAMSDTLARGLDIPIHDPHYMQDQFAWTGHA